MPNASRAFEGLLDRYFEQVLEQNPILATLSGLTSGEGKLGRAGRAPLQQEHQLRISVLEELDRITPSELSNEQHLDRLALRSRLLREEEDFSRRRHGLEPKAIEQFLDILLHELMRGEHEPKRAARNLRSLLAQAPDFLSQAASLLERPEPVWLAIMEQAAEGAPSLFAAVEVFLQRQDPAARDQRDLKACARAVEKYRAKAIDRPKAPAGSFAVGVPMMARRVKDELGLDFSLGQIEALATAEAARLNGLLAEACAKIGRRRKPEDIIEQARAEWSFQGELLDLYRRETGRVARCFQEAGAVTFPKPEKLEVRLVPEFMRHLFPTAAYTSPGAFEKKQRGVFWVNDLSLTKKTEAEKKSERAQHFGLSLTCAHEAYPGHHLQFVTSNRHPRRWRRLFAHAVFYEGWTLWCEQMMVDLKVDRSSWLRVQQLHDALWRCHRILVDLRLQTGRYSYDQGVKHMQKHLGFTQARARADVNWYTGQPGVPMSYWLGRLENERLRRRLMDGRGWSLRQFNDWLLSFGTLPQAWIEKYGLD